MGNQFSVVIQNAKEFKNIKANNFMHRYNLILELPIDYILCFI